LLWRLRRTVNTRLTGYCAGRKAADQDLELHQIQVDRMRILRGIDDRSSAPAETSAIE